jgi:hypothetical protein
MLSMINSFKLPISAMIYLLLKYRCTLNYYIILPIQPNTHNRNAVLYSMNLINLHRCITNDKIISNGNIEIHIKLFERRIKYLTILFILIDCLGTLQVLKIANLRSQSNK